MAKRPTTTTADEYRNPGGVRQIADLVAAAEAVTKDFVEPTSYEVATAMLKQVANFARDAKQAAKGVSGEPTPDEIAAAMLRLQRAEDSTSRENELLAAFLDEIDVRLIGVNADLDRIGAT